MPGLAIVRILLTVSRPVIPDIGDLTVGDQFGPFRIVELVGRGGIGVVYRAVRVADGTEVALKLLRPHLASDPDYRRRFVHEARAAREVSHAALVAVVDAGEANGLAYIASRYIHGASLDALVAREGGLAPDAVIRMARDVGSGIDALHAAGILHRDIKPSNVLVDEAGRASLADFGLAKGPTYTVLTRAGQTPGTLGFMAPELIRGKPPTRATDIYAFGCLVYEALAGQPPFAGPSAFKIVAAHLGELPRDPRQVRPELPPTLARVTLSALAKEPGERPESAEVYAQLLAAAAAD